MEREDYPTDLTSEQWEILQPKIPSEKPGGRPGKTNIREVINAKILMLRSGYVHSVQRLLREPPWQTVYTYFRQWKKWHLEKDTMGFIIAVIVSAASVQDRDGAKLVLKKMKDSFKRLCLIWADGSYA